MAWSRCTVCDVDFTSLSAFDKHLEGPVGNVEHKRPTEIGLEWSEDRQAWKHPDNGQFDKLNNTATARTLDKPTKVYNCSSCGQQFTKLPGRGRPPKDCSDCGGKGVPQKLTS